MSADDQTQRLLSELELNEYETRAYLSVIEGGVMVAREISDRASIPYAKVYQTLNDLIEKQLITGDEGRPKKFRARHPKEAFSDRLKSLEQEWQNKHRHRKAQLDKILPELVILYEASDVNQEELQGVWNISGLTNISSRLAKIVELGKDSILVITGDIDRFEEHFLKILEDSATVPIDLLATDNGGSSVYRNIYSAKHLGNTITIIVDEFAMMSIAEIQKGKYSKGEFTAVLTQISEMVASTRMNYGGLI